MSTDDVVRSNHVVALQKPNRSHTPSRVLRRAVVPEAPALPQPHAREVTGRRSPSSSGAVVPVLLLSLTPCHAHGLVRPTVAAARARHTFILSLSSQYRQIKSNYIS
jgi:hypothetical protein